MAIAPAPGRRVPPLLVVTNDFPPQVGGVQRYVHDLVRHLPDDRVTVLGPRWPGWRSFDPLEPYRIVRYAGSTAVPGPDLRRRMRSLIRESGAEAVLFGHGFPLGVLGPDVARLGLPYAALTHGVEAWMSRIPGARAALRACLEHARVVFTVSEHTGRTIGGALPDDVGVVPLPPGVDTKRFHPSVDGRWVRERHGLHGRRVLVCVSRLVPRKGQDVLIRIWPEVLRRVPEAALLIVGGGPYGPELKQMAAPLADAVIFTGEVAEDDLPGHYAAGDAFAMPCRDEKWGFEVEGLGIVYLEAAATGKPVVTGRSGGAPETVVEGETGFAVDGLDEEAVLEAVVRLLGDPALAGRMGEAGRRLVERRFVWDVVLGRFAAALRGDPV